MKTYTDTERVDFIIRSLEGRNLTPIFKQVEVCTNIDRGTIDAAMRVEEEAKDRTTEAERRRLTAQRDTIIAQLAKLGPPKT